MVQVYTEIILSRLYSSIFYVIEKRFALTSY
jgi:hypothetical protein